VLFVKRDPAAVKGAAFAASTRVVGLSGEELSGRIALCTTIKILIFQGWKSATELYKPYFLSNIIYLIIL
jgi:hypothetical protein